MRADRHVRPRSRLDFGRQSWFALSAFAVACGIEVGNPHGKKGGTSPQSVGALTVAIADAPDDDLRNVYFNIAGMSIVPLDDAGMPGEAIPLEGAVTGKFDIKELNDGRSLTLSSAQSVEAGEYAGIMLHLDQAMPATVVDADGHEQELPLPGRGRRIFIGQSFTISEANELALTLHVDLRRSIGRRQEGDQRIYAFEPIAHLIRQTDGGVIRGKAEDPLATQVCAYLKRRSDFNEGAFDRIPRGPMPPDPRGPGRRPDGPPPEHARLDAKLPPSFAPDAPQVEKDGDATCPRAFATAQIKDGLYALHHLWPGSYFLKFYKEDGTPVEGEPRNVELAPGQKVDVP